MTLTDERRWEYLIARYNQPVARYTSYPTLPNWNDDPAAARERIVAAARQLREGGGLAFYVHVPFCPSLCWYCACNRFITSDRTLVDRYLDAVEMEVHALATRIGTARIGWLHWGGGTPNAMTPAQIGRLFQIVADRFVIARGAEISLEIDPRTTSAGQMRLLASLGFNRVSFGVQDVHEATQQAINRLQTPEQTRSAVEWARHYGMTGINVDLIYGLPLQTRASFARTIDHVLELRPDRVAAYAYAHVPWVNHAQRAYEEKLPSPLEKFGMAVDTANAFAAAGYEVVGIDHYAAPHDTLAQAARRNAVRRTFMGYATHRTEVLLGVGCSAISSSAGAFAQNHKDVAAYVDAVKARSPAARGCLVSPEDAARQRIVETIMTSGRIATADAMPLLLDPSQYDRLHADGIINVRRRYIELTPIGRLFARNVAACFDAYRAGGHTRHASAV